VGSGLREGWEVRKLGDVCDTYNGSTPLRTKKEYWKNGFVECAPLSTVLPVGKTAKKEQGQQQYPVRSKIRAVAIGFVRIPSLIHAP